MAVTRILLVDGEASERKRLGELLAEMAMNQGLELELHEASDGVEAMDLARKHKPQLVLMEIVLEGPHGLQVMRQLRRGKGKNDSPRVVLVTEMATEIDRYWATRCGAHAFVKKPWDPESLREKLEALLAPSSE